jgi:PST family polysaccharide transporter
VAAIPLLLMGDRLAQWLLHQADMSSMFVWLALTLPAIAANNLLLAIVNGKKEVGIYVTANIVGSLISMLLVGLLAFNFGLYGALVALAISPAIVLLATAVIVARRDWFKARFLWGQMNRPALRELSGFALMALTSALTAPISYILIRDYLATSLGLTTAGYWQASWKISEIYLMVITTTLAVYYLPRLAEIRTAQELKTEIFKVYRYVMPIVVAVAVLIYSIRDFIIETLFTPDFLPMRELFQWQLTGDFLKIGSWILSYVMLGRAMVKLFIFTEIFFSATFLLLTWHFVEIYGLVGVAIAYTTNYFCYWIFIAIALRSNLKVSTNGHA